MISGLSLISRALILCFYYFEYGQDLDPVTASIDYHCTTAGTELKLIELLVLDLFASYSYICYSYVFKFQFTGLSSGVFGAYFESNTL